MLTDGPFRATLVSASNAFNRDPSPGFGLQSRSITSKPWAGIVLVTALFLSRSVAAQAVWSRHIIDNSSKGADGVRLADVNGDGLLDIATGWEQGGIVRAYINPGHARVKQRWPAVTAGPATNVEDAVFVDLDGDGAVDVVSSCEGASRSILFHWAPREKQGYLDADAWRTEALPIAQDRTKWMFAVPVPLDGRNGPDLVAGSKGSKPGEATIGWFQAPANARELNGWSWHPLRSAGWIMGIEVVDMNGDGELDIVFTDRFNGARSGCYWLENPGVGPLPDRAWKEHPIGVKGQDALFFGLTDLDGDGLLDIVVGTHEPKGTVPATSLYYLRRLDHAGTRWAERKIPLPADAGLVKSVTAGDINRDGKTDLVVSFVQAKDKSGVLWFSHDGSPFTGRWTSHPLSGPEGVKYDGVSFVDLDGDGDLDVITTEETANLGVIWYENPTMKAS